MAWIQDCCKLVFQANGGNKYDPLPEVTFEAAWQTMVCGMTENGKRPSKFVYRRAFTALFGLYQLREFDRELKQLVDAGVIASVSSLGASSPPSHMADSAIFPRNGLYNALIKSSHPDEPVTTTDKEIELTRKEVQDIYFTESKMNRVAQKTPSVFSAVAEWYSSRLFAVLQPDNRFAAVPNSTGGRCHLFA
jgi:hypothetical protein